MTILIRLILTFIIGFAFVLEAWACEPFPVSVQFSDIKTASATVSWLKIDPNHVYQVSWRPKGQLSWNTSPILNPDNERFILTNLKDGTEYDVQVRSKCIAEPAFSPYAQTSLGFKTGSRLCAEENPTPPNRFHLKSVNGKFAIVQWENISDASGTHISYGLTNQPVSKWRESVLCKGEESFIIKDLKPNTSYLVRVRTLCTQCQTTNDPKKSRWTTALLFKTTNDTTFTEPQQIVSGRVYDDRLQPIANAQVTVGAKKVQTDANGRYFIPFSWQERTMVKAEHPDFMTRTVGFYPTKADTVFCSVLMEKFKVTHTFNGKDAMLLGNTAFTVQLPENSIVDQTTGQLYTGTVKACITSARPGDPLFGERMPGGDFLAINAQGQERVLYSYGFFSCELRGENDQKLNLAPGVKASVAFQIAEDQQTKALPTMPLWHFDEQASIWKEEGTATRQGNTYIGEVSHFSSWNCDWQGPRCWVEGVLLLCEGTRARGGTAYADYMPAEADIEGKYRRWVPAEFPSPINVFTETTANEPYTLAANLPVDQTFIAPPMTIAPIRAAGIAQGDTAQIYASAVGMKDDKPTLEYSLDSTKWQASAMFTNLPEQDSYTCWVRVKGTDCAVKVEVKVLKKVCRSCRIKKVHKYKEFALLVFPDIFGYLNYGYEEPEDSLVLTNLHTVTLDDQFKYRQFIDMFGSFSCLNALECYEWINDSNSFIDLISNLKYLQYLKISVGNIQEIPSSIGNLANLEYLNLHGVSSRIPQTIKNLKALKMLNLTGSYYEIPLEVTELVDLKSLRLSSRNFSNLPPQVKNLRDLEELELDDCISLNSLPKEIENLSQLKKLNLSGNQMSTLPEEIWNLSQLQTLILSNNSLGSLPSEIGKLSQLQSLSLTNTSLSNVPAEIWNLSKLQTLDLTFNRLISLPSEIGNLSQLERLGLNNTSLSNLPAEIWNLSKLQVLYLSNNQFTSLPPEIANLKDSLKELNLQGCPISEEEQAKIRSWLPNTQISF